MTNLPPIDLTAARELIRTQSAKSQPDGFIYRFVRAAWLVLEALDAAEARIAQLEGTRLPVRRSSLDVVGTTGGKATVAR